MSGEFSHWLVYDRKMTESDVSSDTEAAIMHATYRALCANGYAETTISAIAEEFEKSKSLLYYHYDDKEALLNDFLLFMLDELESELGGEEDDPRERLWGVIDMLLPPESDEEAIQFRRALLEARANAPHSATYHEQFARSDELILDRLTEAIQYGVDRGAFHAVDTRETAEFLYSTAYGGLERGVTLDDDEPIRRTRDAVASYLEDTVFCDDAGEP
ncbi:MAG: TetR/AcrR family transcriptional regulator [Halobaculum sp.]